MSIVLDGTTGIAAPALDSDGSLTLGTAVMAVPTGDAPLFGCRAWVNFDGTKDTTGATSTANTNRLIRGSGNVTSVLRTATGKYTITFTTAMPDADYVVNALGSGISTTTYMRDVVVFDDTITSASVGLGCQHNQTYAYIDVTLVSVAIFR